MSLKERLEKNLARRSVEMRFWSRRTDRFRQAVEDGWSTFWLAREFRIQPRTARRLRRQIEGA